LKNIAVVQNFPEVFPNDIPTLPPNKEIEFSIDVCRELDQSLHHIVCHPLN